MFVPVVGQEPLAISVGIFELFGLQRPKEPPKPQRAQKQRNRDQINEHFHEDYFNLSALIDTVIDDSDIAKAAASGVANPSNAIGTATAL